MIGAIVALALFCAFLLAIMIDDTVAGRVHLPKAIAMVAGMIVGCALIGAGLEHLARLAWAWLLSGPLA